MQTYKILIVEDEIHMADYLRMELVHEGYQVEIACNGRDGLSKIENNIYQLVILDVMLPGINGIELCRRVRLFSNVVIIMLTAKSETIDKVTGLDIGADDYMTKPFAIEELLARIRVIRRNQALKKQREITISDLVMNHDTHQVRRGSKLIDLTKKEYDLLENLLINKNIVLTRDQLINQIWGYDYAGDTNVVDVYIRYLRSKMDDSYEKKLIKTVRGVGYMIKDDDV